MTFWAEMQSQETVLKRFLQHGAEALNEPELLALFLKSHSQPDNTALRHPHLTDN